MKHCLNILIFGTSIKVVMLKSVRCLSRACVSGLQSSQTQIVHSRNASTLPSLKIYSLRRRIAEKFANSYNTARVSEIGPDLACLEWLMECGSTQITMSDNQSIGNQKEMREFVKHWTLSEPPETQVKLAAGDLAYEKKWPNAPKVHIVKVDASDSAIANPGFAYFKELKRLEVLKLNFCDYFGDEGLRELAMGTPAATLKDLEIVLNPCMTDGAVYWLSRMKALRRAHFYFLPYVTNRQAFVRQVKTALPRCNVTFPEVENIGYGYDEAKKQK